MKLNKRAVALYMAKNTIDRKELSKLAEIPISTIDNVLFGRNTRPKTVGKIAKALGVDVTEIIETE